MKKYSLVVTGNYLNHYELALSKEFMKFFNEFHFIVGEKLPEDRKKLGFSDMNDLSFVVKAYENKKLAKKLILDADIVITGSYRYENHINERLKQGKIVFFDSERLFKYNSLLNCGSALINIIRHRYAKKASLLCISAYSAGDYNKINLFKNRTYKWGYFTEAIQYDDINKLINDKKENSIIWVGRLIEWKHPEYVVEIAKRLEIEGYNFTANIIGVGDMSDKLKTLIKEYKLDDKVHMLGSMPPDKVRRYMEESQIYLFTSDKGEGFGVVLNEAMNSGCACVASYSTGSTPFVVKDGKNGLVYKNDSIDDLYDRTKYLLDNKEKIKKIGKEAYNSIVSIWNPHEAAKRFYSIAKQMMENGEITKTFDEDILSIAKPIE